MDDDQIAPEDLNAFWGRMRFVSDTMKRRVLETARVTAPDFNVFRQFIASSEMRLSSVIAWMLDAEGTHAQGDAFLRQFLELLHIACPPGRVRVRTEVVIPGGRLDILLEGACHSTPGSRWLLAIENKPFAQEGEDQLKSYKQYLERQTEEFHLVYVPGSAAHITALTVTGIHLLPYRDRGSKERRGLETWIHRCSGVCRADNVCRLLDQFAEYVAAAF